MSFLSSLSTIRAANSNVNKGNINVQNGKFKEAVPAYKTAADLYRTVLHGFQGPKEISGLIEVTLELLKNEINVVNNICESAWDTISSSSDGTGGDSPNFALNRSTIDIGTEEELTDSPVNFPYKRGSDSAAGVTVTVDSCLDEDSHSVEIDSVVEHRKKWEKYFERLAEWPAGEGFQDIIGHSKIKTLLVSTIFLHPESQFNYLVKDSTATKPNILLYGPSGTGKTKLARAYAIESRMSTFIPVTASDIMSKWIGEAESRLKALLDVAERLAPTIIFVDEVDGILGGERDNHNTSNFINEFLIRIEKVLDVQVLAATNIPWRLHSSVLRRFQYIIEVPLPNLGTRVQILRQFLGPSSLLVSEFELYNLGKLCERYSPADLSRAIQFARLLPALIVQRSQYFKTVNEN